MKEVLNELDALLDRLGDVPADQPPGDAIDEILSDAPRKTAVTPLRDHETVKRFRQEVTDGLIRLDTARQLIGLIRLAIETYKP